MRSLGVAAQPGADPGYPADAAVSSTVVKPQFASVSVNNTIYAGNGQQIIFDGSYGKNVIYGDPLQKPSTVDVLIGGPGGTDPGTQPGQLSPDATPDPAASGADDTITAGSGDTVMIGSPGKNTFNINGDESHPANRIVWGNSGTSSYHFTGPSNVIIVYMDNPTIKKVSNLRASDIDAALEGKSFTPNGMGYVGVATVIINPGTDDSIYLNGIKLGEADYQKFGTEYRGRYDVYGFFGDSQIGPYVPLNFPQVLASG